MVTGGLTHYRVRLSAWAAVNREKAAALDTL